jgi:hypothetical protein
VIRRPATSITAAQLEIASKSPYSMYLWHQFYLVDYAREQDGRWLANREALPGVMTYGKSRDEALQLNDELTQRVLSEKYGSWGWR